VAPAHVRLRFVISDSLRRTTRVVAVVAVVACAPAPPRTSAEHATIDPCAGRPTTNVRRRLAAGELLSALRVSEWACVDEETRNGLAGARAWLAEPADPDAALAEAVAARARGDHVLARRLFDRAALGMQRAGSPPRWELPGPFAPAGDAIFLGSTHVASVAGTRVVLTDVATGARRLLWPHADSVIVRLAASGDGRFLAVETGDEVLVWDGPDFAGRVRVIGPPARFAAKRWTPSMEFAPNGRTLVLAHKDGITLWDTTTHKTIAVVAGSEFLFVGEQLVVDGTVVVEPATGNVLAKLPPIHRAEYWNMVASPDGRVFLRQWGEKAGSPEHPKERHGVEAWSSNTWRPLGTFETGPVGFTGPPVFSRDGTRIFAPLGTWLGVFDRERRRLEVAWPAWTMANEPRHPVRDPRALEDPKGIPDVADEYLQHIELTPDERRVIACDGSGCKVFDWRTGRHGTVGRDAQVLPDGSVISRDRERPGRFDVLDPDFETRHLELGRGDVELVPTTSDPSHRSSKLFVPLEPCGPGNERRVSADGSAVVEADTPGRPCVWTRDDGQLRPRPPELPDFAPPPSLDLSGTRLLLAGAGWVRALEVETGELSQAPEADVARVRGYAAERRNRGSPVALAPGWIALATGRYVDALDAASHERRRRLDCGTDVEGVALDASAGQVAASCGGRIIVWELATGTVLRRLELPDPRARLGPFALRGDWIVATVGTELVAFQGRVSAESRWRWQSPGRTVAVATDGRVVAAAHAPGDVSLYSLADGGERPTLRLWNASAPEAVIEASDGAIWDAAGGLLSMSRCVRGDREVPTELCESLWVQDDLWRRQSVPAPRGPESRAGR
jgi:WD40 repeat protein